MAYYLAFDGVNDKAQTDGKILPMPASGIFTYTVKLRLYDNPYVIAIAQSRFSSDSALRIGARFDDTYEIQVGGTYIRTDSADGIITDRTHIIKVVGNIGTSRVDFIILEEDGTTVIYAKYDEPTGTIRYDYDDAELIMQPGAAVDLYRIEMEGFFVFDPSASGGTGLVLPETMNSHNAALTGFPADDSQWVFYSTGPNTPINPSITDLLATSARLNWEQG